MPSKNQRIGKLGEKFVTKMMNCLKCKKQNSLKLLPTNFKCADLICEFCGHTSQVKTFRNDSEGLPNQIAGAKWNPLNERIQAGIYHALWIVRMNQTNNRCCEIWLVTSEAQDPKMFVKRKPLSSAAKKAGWQGYRIDVANHADRFIKVL